MPCMNWTSASVYAGVCWLAAPAARLDWPGAPGWTTGGCAGADPARHETPAIRTASVTSPRDWRRGTAHDNKGQTTRETPGLKLAPERRAFQCVDHTHPGKSQDYGVDVAGWTCASATLRPSATRDAGPVAYP